MVDICVKSRFQIASIEFFDFTPLFSLSLSLFLSFKHKFLSPLDCWLFETQLNWESIFLIYDLVLIETSPRLTITTTMVCIPCIVIPLVLWFWHKYIQPYVLMFWNPWGKKIESKKKIGWRGERVWLGEMWWVMALKKKEQGNGSWKGRVKRRWPFGVIYWMVIWVWYMI